MHMASETLSASAIVFCICLPINRKNKRQFNFLPLVKYLYFIFRITPTIDIEPIYEKQKSVLNENGFFGGRRWIRTTEVSDNRFTVCPLWPLGNSPICKAYCLNSRLILELVDGLEPPTCWLQISCSTNWATPAFSLFYKRFCFVFVSLVDCSYIIPYEVPNVNTFFEFF